MLTSFEQTPKPRLSSRQKQKAVKVLSILAPRASRRAARNEWAEIHMEGMRIYVSE
jgi:hypothetical protein